MSSHKLTEDRLHGIAGLQRQMSMKSMKRHVEESVARQQQLGNEASSGEIDRTASVDDAPEVGKRAGGRAGRVGGWVVGWVGGRAVEEVWEIAGMPCGPWWAFSPWRDCFRTRALTSSGLLSPAAGSKAHADRAQGHP